MLKKFSWEDYSILLVALAVGVLMIGPSFYFRYFDPAYQGIEFFGSDAESDYLAQVQEIYDGHWSSGNIYLADQKDAPYLKQNLSPIIIAMFGKISGLSARDINMAVKFVLPALLAILVYWFFAGVFGRKDLAILMAVFVMLVQASWAFLNPASWPAILLRGEFPGTNASFLSFARPINPQVSSFFFFGYLLCLWKFLFGLGQNLKSEKWWGLASAVILGLSFYTYPFAYSFLFAVNGSLAFYFLFLKDWKQFKKIIYVSLGAVIIGAFYLISLFKALFSPLYGQAAKIAGVLDTRQFIFSRVWWGTAAIFFFFYKGPKQAKIFVWAFLAAAFLVTNQQLITGRTAPVPAHYHWYYIAPIAGAILLYLAVIHAEKFLRPFWAKAGMALAVLVFLYSGFLFQKNSYAAAKEDFASLQRYAEPVFWLEKNIPKESAILANNELSNLLAGYTRHNVYSSGYAVNFFITPERQRHLYYLRLFLDGITRDKAKTYFYENRDWVGGYFFGQYYRQKNGCYGCFPDVLLEDLLSGYENFLSRDFLAELKQYPLDYIVWDKAKNPEWRMDRFFSKKIYEEDEIIIYSAF